MGKRLVLGLDTGGTHTDAVVYDPGSRSVLASSKAVTTHHNLTLGISQAMEKLAAATWEGGLEAIKLINISTTLATNAIAENKGRQVGLVMMGYDRDQTAVRELVRDLTTVIPVFVAGSHDFYGQEDTALDEKALLREVRRLDSQVESWAVSGYFSVKNPGHELRAAELIKSVSDKPTTMGQTLTGQLNAVRRAATAALNAGLVTIISSLLDAVKHSAAALGLKARLMVVKGDGTLVSEDWARERPIETVVSGPAAGLIGAKLLARGLLSETETNLWVMDVGGTTTDLAYVETGLPAINPNGARVGQWETMTLAVETRTRGLGGDSLVFLNRDREIVLGPRRVLPLCRLALQYPLCLDELARQNAASINPDSGGYFFVPGTPPGPGLDEDEAWILRALDAGRAPYSMARYSSEAWAEGRFFSGLRTINHPAILVSAFTPTDAMVILGLYSGGSLKAAQLGASILARPLGLTPEEFARRVLDEFGRLLAQELLSYSFLKDGVEFRPDLYQTNGIFGQTLGRRPAKTLRLSCRLTDTVVLLGAPVAVLAPWLGKYIKSRILVPPIFDVASAVGAAASPIQLTRQVDIQVQPSFAGYRLFLPGGPRDADTVDELAALAEKTMTVYMDTLARLAGAEQAKVTMSRQDRLVRLGDGSTLNLGVGLTFKAEEA